MPRKTKTEASTAQNRESQRRARARHREFVDDLQRQLKDFQEHGVRATLEMQKAARAIDLENQSLRGEIRGLKSFLASRGLLEEAEALLRLPLAEVVDNRDGHTLPVLATLEYDALKNSDADAVPLGVSPLLPILERQNTETSCIKLPPISIPDVGARISSQNHHSYHTQSSVLPRIQQHHFGNYQAPSPLSSNPSKTIDKDHGNTLKLLEGQQSLQPRNHDPDAGSEMSCWKAAEILAQLNGHHETSKALVELGCKDRRECHVKNTKVFELMKG